MPDEGKIALEYVLATRAVSPAPLSRVTALVIEPVPLVVAVCVSLTPPRTRTLPVPRAFTPSKKVRMEEFEEKSQLTLDADALVRVRAFGPVTNMVPAPATGAARVKVPPLMFNVPVPDPTVMPRFAFNVKAAVVFSVAPSEIVIRSAAKEPVLPRFRSALACRVPEVIASLVVNVLVPASTSVPTPFLMMEGVVPLSASVDEIVTVAPVPRELTVISALFAPLFIVIGAVPLTTQLAAVDVSASPKMKLPRDRLVSRLTVRLAVMLLANVAVPLTPPAIVLFSQLVVTLQSPSALTFQLPLVCARASLQVAIAKRIAAIAAATRPCVNKRPDPCRADMIPPLCVTSSAIRPRRVMATGPRIPRHSLFPL